MNHFGDLRDGRAVERHCIGSATISAEILTYGACWRGLWRIGDPGNWLSAHERIDQIEEDPGYRGFVVGRVAGRLPEACDFGELGPARLAAQTPGVILHGGAQGSARRIWQVLEASDRHILLMDRLDHLHMGFPGAVEITAEYRAVGDTLSITLNALALSDTVVNFAPHPYFLLGPNLGEHSLVMNADKVQPTNSLQLPDGPLTDIPADHDFRTSRAIRDVEIDHKFVGQEPFQAEVSHPSGRRVRITSDAVAAQVFIGRNLAAAPGQADQGLALEPQIGAPDANGVASNFVLLREGQSFVTSTKVELRSTSVSTSASPAVGPM